LTHIKETKNNISLPYSVTVAKLLGSVLHKNILMKWRLKIVWMTRDQFSKVLKNFLSLPKVWHKLAVSRSVSKEYLEIFMKIPKSILKIFLQGCKIILQDLNFSPSRQTNFSNSKISRACQHSF